MKQINETFDDSEFEKLKEKKGDKSWHDFIMSLTRIHQFDDLEEEVEF